jgi:hypothetical protein
MSKQGRIVDALIDGFAEGASTSVTVMVHVPDFPEPIQVDADGHVTIPDAMVELAPSIRLDLQAIG